METERDLFEQGSAETEVNAVNEAQQQQLEERLSRLDGSKANPATNHNDSEEPSRMFPGVL